MSFLKKIWLALFVAQGCQCLHMALNIISLFQGGLSVTSRVGNHLDAMIEHTWTPRTILGQAGRKSFTLFSAPSNILLHKHHGDRALAFEKRHKLWEEQ